MSNIKDEFQKAESEVKAFFEKLITDIKAKLPPEHHAAVDEVAAEATTPDVTYSKDVLVSPPAETTNINAS